MEEPFRVLQIMSSLNCANGVAQVVLNWHRHIDRFKVQFDYLLHIPSSGKNCFNEEVNRLGGRIFCVPFEGIRDSLNFVRGIKNFFQKNHYNIVHSHLTHLNAICFPLAKLYGTKTIIQHTHSTAWSDKKARAIRNYLLLHTVWPLIDYRLACSNLAGKVYFKKNYSVINNGIDLEKFCFYPNIREQTRAELKLQDKFVVGHIGRFAPMKNHFFLVDIFEQIHKMCPDSALLLIGGGPCLQRVQEYAQQKHIAEHVLFLGVQKDVNNWLHAMDVFIFPSLFEGLGLAAIEAQANGLPVLVSDGVPQDVLVCNAQQIPLTATAAYWANEALKMQRERDFCFIQKALQNANFDIFKNIEQIQNFYLALAKKSC